MRKRIRQLHFLLTVTVGLPIVISGLTGSALVYRRAIDRRINPELTLASAPGRAGESQLASLDQVVQVVRKANPDRTPLSLRLPQHERDMIEVWLAGDEPTVNPIAYVDPFTGQLRGTRLSDAGLMGFLRDLHVNLLAGERGHIIVGIVGIGLIMLVATGLVLWWPGVRRIGQGLWFRLKRSWKRTNYDLHRVGGAWAAVLLILLATSGVALVFHDVALTALRAGFGEGPAPDPPQVDGHQSEQSPSLDRMLAAARSAVPEAVPTWVTITTSPSIPANVRMRCPGELHPNGKSRVYLDPADATILQVYRAPEAGLGQRIYDLLYPLHIGHVGMPVMQVVTCVAGLSPTILMITGSLLWWQRRRGRRKRLRHAASVAGAARQTTGSGDLPKEPARRVYAE